jgi:alkylation response protein AidB-like acyl-CoA dehydrogenase
MKTIEQPAGCDFFSTTPERIFTPEEFGSDDRMMIETARDFARKEVVPLVERLDKQEPGLMVQLIRQAGELGLCGVDSPAEFGGLGLEKNLSARILEMMSPNGSFAVTYGITSGISQVGLSLFGTDEQKARYLPKLTSGEWIGAYALSEPNSGSDALAATTRADLQGDNWVLNGTKMWITNAQWANLFLVMAKIDGQRFSAFLVERDSPGVVIGREEHKLGLKGSSTARVMLENAIVPKENLLHEDGKGHHVALNALNIGRFKLSSMSIGPCRDAVSLAANYALERKQFGVAIAQFGLIKQKLALMSAWFYAAESMNYRTGAMMDAAFQMWGGSVDGNRKAAEEYAVECSACKVMATEAQARIVDEALQVFGGYGFTEEFPIARHYRDARVSRIYEGTNEINRLSLRDRQLRRANSGKASLESVGDSYISTLAGEAAGIESDSQIVIGAQSDLAMLAFAEQSSRLRAAQTTAENRLRHEVFVDWANARAAEAYQTATGKATSLPASAGRRWEELADLVLAAKGLGQP